mmetsp:Transcript_59108/g.145046  ORF Transcript_59108/g.145046 Transcript_59108/m.145046 type:complete len:291 (+) Transcript_59108:251-1123(+)
MMLRRVLKNSVPSAPTASERPAFSIWSIFLNMSSRSMPISAKDCFTSCTSSLVMPPFISSASCSCSAGSAAAIIAGSMEAEGSPAMACRMASSIPSIPKALSSSSRAFWSALLGPSLSSTSSTCVLPASRSFFLSWMSPLVLGMSPFFLESVPSAFLKMSRLILEEMSSSSLLLLSRSEVHLYLSLTSFISFSGGGLYDPNLGALVNCTVLAPGRLMRASSRMEASILKLVVLAMLLRKSSFFFLLTLANTTYPAPPAATAPATPSSLGSCASFLALITTGCAPPPCMRW